jgi:hypothetical protein
VDKILWVPAARVTEVRSDPAEPLPQKNWASETLKYNAVAAKWAVEIRKKFWLLP